MRKVNVLIRSRKKQSEEEEEQAAWLADQGAPTGQVVKRPPGQTNRVSLGRSLYLPEVGGKGGPLEGRHEEGQNLLVNQATDGTRTLLHIEHISAAYTSHSLTAFRRFAVLGGLRDFRQQTPKKKTAGKRGGQCLKPWRDISSQRHPNLLWQHEDNPG